MDTFDAKRQFLFDVVCTPAKLIKFSVQKSWTISIGPNFACHPTAPPNAPPTRALCCCSFAPRPLLSSVESLGKGLHIRHQQRLFRSIIIIIRLSFGSVALFWLLVCVCLQQVASLVHEQIEIFLLFQHEHNMSCILNLIGSVRMQLLR